jgi:hypothetical protein
MNAIPKTPGPGVTSSALKGELRLHSVQIQLELPMNDQMTLERHEAEARTHRRSQQMALESGAPKWAAIFAQLAEEHEQQAADARTRLARSAA